MPWSAHGLVHQPVGFIVACDLFGNGIEMNFAAHADGDICQVHDGDGSVGGTGDGR